MAVPESITFRVVESAKLKAIEHSAIDDLLRTSLAIDFPDREPGEINGLVRESSTYRSDPNQSVGGKAIRGHQSFARSVNVLALDRHGKLLAHLPAADNASSPVYDNLPGVVSEVVGAGLRQAKLHGVQVRGHGEGLMRRRWLWLGLCGLSERARDLIADTNRSEVLLTDGLLLAAAKRRHDLQPVSSYPYDGEFAWKRSLAWAGFTPEAGSRMQITAFGTRSDEVGQEKWTQSSVGDMQEIILAKQGAEQLLAQVKSGRS